MRLPIVSRLLDEWHWDPRAAAQADYIEACRQMNARLQARRSSAPTEAGVSPRQPAQLPPCAGQLDAAGVSGPNAAPAALSLREGE